ncbi:hypothetical protein MPF19_11915 [Polaribacter sp. Z014]|uniref:hypothetical protein n=1 Tax=unclassified Polaribacter TaxID=196858 RepID=UPI00193BC428|nr:MULTISPECIES: hypothetical protein [unclassified Polaribacter]MCL7764125.1 hypothetical protein [Polaribacter sp. Z014]QVY65220.1 hypothetical protein JOP69_15950 [Polaribacter sp. Q13]
MFLGAYFTSGRIVFMIFFIIAFTALMIYSYRKDIKNHKRYYKDTGIKVLMYGGIIIAVFIAIRILWGQ